MIRILITLPLLLIAACGAIPSQNELTISRFAVLSEDGFDGGGGSNERGGEISGAQGGGVAYRMFIDRREGLVGEAGVLPQTEVGPLRDGGIVRFTGQYQVMGVDDIDIRLTSADGSPFRLGGDISLVANFDDGRLRGSVGDLTIEGQFEDETLGGWVTFRGVRGELSGLIGGDDAVGAFQGDNRTLVYTGGLVVGR